MKSQIIYNQKLAGYLCLKGFKIHAMAENNKCYGKNVFFFSWSPALIKAIEYYQEKEKQIEQFIGNSND